MGTTDTTDIIVALGKFDALHRGHRSLAETAAAMGGHPYLLSFRGIDNLTYYMVDMDQYTQLVNWSGCGNTINANHPVRDWSAGGWG